jgi:hypothetical protein
VSVRNQLEEMIRSVPDPDDEVVLWVALAGRRRFRGHVESARVMVRFRHERPNDAWVNVTPAAFKAPGRIRLTAVMLYKSPQEERPWGCLMPNRFGIVVRSGEAIRFRPGWLRVRGL